MNILLINNNTEHLEALSKNLAVHNVEIQRYQPGMKFNDEGKDLVILSGGGGEGLEITDRVTPGKLWYQDEMEFVRNTDKPVLGICMGFEIIVKSFGGKVYYRPKLTLGEMKSHLTDSGQKIFKHKDIKQVEAHYWYVPEVPESELEVLGRSTSGIEIVKHKNKKIMGTQFHPEEGGTLELQPLIAHL